MNVLVVANKDDSKVYQSVIKTAPNSNLLGTVNSIGKNFIDSIKIKYHPHIILFDTSVSHSKKYDLHRIIAEINNTYPYIKVLLFTTPNDIDFYNKLGIFAVISSPISNVEIHKLLKQAETEYNNISVPIKTSMQNKEEFTEEVDNLSTSPKNSFDENSENKETSVEGIINSNIVGDKELFTDDTTEKNIATADIKKIKFKKAKKQRNFELKYIIIVAIAVLVIVTITGICIKSCGDNKNNISTNDEPKITEAVANEAGDYISFTDASENTTALMSENNLNATSNSQEKETSKDSESKTDSTSKNNSDKADDSDKSNNQSSNSNNNKSDNNTNNDSGGSSGGSVEYNNNNNNYSNNNKEVSSISLSYTHKTIYTGDSFNLTANISPSNATDKSITWQSSNNNIAYVSNGYVTAKNQGTTTITASAGGKSATCSVTVNAKIQTTADPVYLSCSNKTISLNQTQTIYLNNSESCSWYISNPSVVQILGGGSNKITIKGKSEGTTYITATNKETGKEYQFKLIVE